MSSDGWEIYKDQVVAKSGQVTKETPSTKPILDRAKMQTVIDAVVANTVKADDQFTGAATQQLYEESQEQPELLEMLDAVLNYRATAEQYGFFRTYINAARQASKAQESE
ncbi:MAG: hypothetical protein M1816_004425 [Peltula sp. TS41687]|nr:MAG: hypothetical protein M1816_004425 [Peltula sp. TS41687]